MPILATPLRLTFLLFVLLIGVTRLVSASAITLVPDIQSALDMTIQPVPGMSGAFEIATTGQDPRILIQPLPGRYDPDTAPVISFEYFCPDGVDPLEIYIGPPITAANLLLEQPLPKAERWMPFAANLRPLITGDGHTFDHFRLDFGRKPGVRLQIRNLQVRPAAEEELLQARHEEATRAAKETAGRRYLDYLGTGFPGKITSVRADATAITVIGELPGGPGNTSLALAEFPAWSDPWADPLPVPLSLTPLQTSPDSTIFVQSLSRSTPEAGDRLFSRWAIVRRQDDNRLALASHAVFASDVVAENDLPELRPRTAKGMGGIEWHSDALMDELVELGVHNATINIHLVALMNAAPGRDAIEHTVDGTGWRFDRAATERYDRLVKFCTDHDIVVSAILLLELAPHITAPNTPRPALVHPEAVRPGLYAMPDLTSAEGVRAYRAVLDFLAQRYARPDKRHGWIGRWILHNEVDYAWTWTNMGKQPLPIYMDAHTRSMRLAWLTARRYNPHAKVFISLTHNWTTPGSPDNRTYRVRDMLELLTCQSATEGDFEWGVAYHPYPQSLLRPETWNDTAATHDFETPFITPKNIEVLDAWLRQPRYLYQGKKPRTVLLSEQGFHTPDYGEEAQRIQAAGFVYTWHKIRPLMTIEAFHNHRWIDHPDEGGLKVGLRTLPEPNLPFGRKKYAWEVYRALDTADEPAATAFAKEIIGIRDFGQITMPPPDALR